MSSSQASVVVTKQETQETSASSDVSDNTQSPNESLCDSACLLPSVLGESFEPYIRKRNASKQKELTPPLVVAAAAVLDPEDSTIQRLKINSRERKRMHDLNHALQQLRSVMPSTADGSRHSKIATLHAAREHITQLQHKHTRLCALVEQMKTMLLEQHSTADLQSRLPDLANASLRSATAVGQTTQQPAQQQKPQQQQTTTKPPHPQQQRAAQQPKPPTANTNTNANAVKRPLLSVESLLRETSPKRRIVAQPATGKTGPTGPIGGPAVCCMKVLTRDPSAACACAACLSLLQQLLQHSNSFLPHLQARFSPMLQQQLVMAQHTK